ncbi:MAG: DUF4339 domain-containing protein [Fimbriimonas ginsengisoli]|uniref:DUF4339 domain-containing protein n=1 Tax=Fimbriimonas ginsengisoli TaxID=1005039 RepID=A0A931M252_FIMGI|nr:DUF4339 domain-containing protein [Fimbriimonas ginsengisoli]MBI3721057.1 DUF4339 domain-containing protein [Fimbriimonas ginsengisoli]
MAEWFYIGHYGQLGPLTREQMEELIAGGVIERETYVWKAGMSDWLTADRVAELGGLFIKADPFAAPPPPPAPNVPTRFRADRHAPITTQPGSMLYSGPRSDKSRLLAGLLNILLPFGVGRMYLGYAAVGVLQMVLALCGVGVLWSFFDGIIILAGGVRFDGYGRVMSD